VLATVAAVAPRALRSPDFERLVRMIEIAPDSGSAMLRPILALVSALPAPVTTALEAVYAMFAGFVEPMTDVHAFLHFAGWLGLALWALVSAAIDDTLWEQRDGEAFTELAGIVGAALTRGCRWTPQSPSGSGISGRTVRKR
jgi:hypothetical protein